VVDFSDDDPEIVKLVIAFLYTTEFSDVRKIATIVTPRIFGRPATDSKPAPDTHALLKRTKVYVLADRLVILALKKLAATKYKEILPNKGLTSSFTASVKLMFEETLENDRLLKEVAVKIADLTEREQFLSLCKERGDIAVEFIKAITAGTFIKNCPTCAKDGAVRQTSKNWQNKNPTFKF